MGSPRLRDRAKAGPRVNSAANPKCKYVLGSPERLQFVHWPDHTEHPTRVLRLHAGEQAARHILRGCHQKLGRSSRQYKDDVVEGFTNRYGVHRLVCFETHGDIRDAIIREKQIKGWNRAERFG
jgi:predicted GIY-YIG superfamily endonuclease